MDTNYQTGKTSPYSIMAIVLFCIALLGVIFFIKPSWDEVTSMSLGRDDKQTQKQELQDKLVGLQKIQQDLNSASEVTKETSLSAIPEKLEEDKLILDLANITRQNDIVLNSVSFGIPLDVSDGSIVKATVNANLVGTESDLIKFLKGVESNGRKMVVRTITVQLASAAAGINLANFNVSMDTFFQGKI